MAADVWLIRTEGGSVVPMSPPFGEGIAQRIEAGLLVRINEDGTDWTDAPAPANAGAPAGADPSLGSLDRPARSDPKADWVAYAAQVSDLSREALDEKSKADLIKEFG